MRSMTALKRKARRQLYLDSIGFLNNRVIAAHVVWPMTDELSLLKKHGVAWFTIRSRT